MPLDKSIVKQAAKELIISICENKKNEYYNSLIDEFTHSFPNFDVNKKHDFSEEEQNRWDEVWSNAKRAYYIEVYKEVSKRLIQKGAVEHERFKRHINGRTGYNELLHFIVRDTPKAVSAGKLYKSYYYSLTGTEANTSDCIELDGLQESMMKEEIEKVKEYYSKNFT